MVNPLFNLAQRRQTERREVAPRHNPIPQPETGARQVVPVRTIRGSRWGR